MKFVRNVWRSYWWLISILLMVVVAWRLMNSEPVKIIYTALTPPVLPELMVQDQSGQWLAQRWLDQNWDNRQYQASDQTREYHHLSQGTRTLPIPYQWLVSLEAPAASPIASLFDEQVLFKDNRYLLRFGFIRSTQHDELNPDGLPIGFAKTPAQKLNGVNVRADAIGFTCAACHTGHFVAETEQGLAEYIIEGGPATTDLGQLTKALGAALGQTAIASKLPIFNSRFDRFARRVLGQQYSAATKQALADELSAMIIVLKDKADVIEVTEGFGRLDALNRIGNQVFSRNLQRPDNYQPINAPVNFPHIWTASWFNWVQYDGSIMQPLVRNAGEALGVSAYQNITAEPALGRFQSSIPLANLTKIERFLAGQQPTEQTGFGGLLAPAWPFARPEEDSLNRGEELYRQHCSHCHLPALNSAEIWQSRYFGPIEYWRDGIKKHTTDQVLQLKHIAIEQVGTDAAQASILLNRTVNTAADSADNISRVGLDQQLCTPDPSLLMAEQLSQPWWQQSQAKNIELRLQDGANISFALALGAIVEASIEAGYQSLGLNAVMQAELSGNRPNCLQAGLHYKARPLNGIWATPPYLHNGSVASLRDLICPTNGQRPELIRLGNLGYDIANIGLSQPESLGQTAASNYDEKGYFLLDTSIEGNSNSGHHFSSQYDDQKPYYQQPKGIIGPLLNDRQCDDLLAYVKML
ncbi:hypothetical protein SIN8267_00711 [Sinobacterium norvegicum]|uniref:Cytochrome c domain-containing protein n=1 Tax=Sinobacterium norvegicum TaxID=1641715 RepID=A0ABN8EE74_9GAMM|nr:di-heme-cytochrome C peroxidase [Sinobacterium norvegicum]CAH0990617.1 hypothetical protein SIN8267_00711 [Sinobacterium norvegicum]